MRHGDCPSLRGRRVRIVVHTCRGTSRIGRSRQSPRSPQFEQEGERAMEMDNLRELLVDELKDIYNAEQQLTKALPRMAKKASNPELKNALETHLRETEAQIDRLEQVFEALGEKAKGKTCPAMKGIIEEGKEVMSEDMDDDVMDAALIAAAQKAEHYE